MFCFEVEQTAGCGRMYRQRQVRGEAGGYGSFEDQQTGSLIGLARAAEGMSRDLQLIKSLSRDYLQPSAMEF